MAYDAHFHVLKCVRDLDAAYTGLQKAVAPIAKATEKAVARHSSKVRQRAEAVDQAREALRSVVEGNPDLFHRPRTATCGRVTYGLRKAPDLLKGSRVQMVSAIQRLMPERAPDLLRTKVETVDAAIKGLGADELRSIGAEVERRGDRLFLRIDDDDKAVLDRILAAVGDADD